MSAHIGNTGPMLASPRCGAKTRSGGASRSPAVHGKKRCRMHGGAQGAGAPKANQNARKHGLFTRDAIAERRQIQALLGEARRFLQGMKRSGFAKSTQTKKSRGESNFTGKRYAKKYSPGDRGGGKLVHRVKQSQRSRTLN